MRAILALALFAAAPALVVSQERVPAKKLAKAEPVVVPFELLDSRHMAVMVKLNGKGPYKLIFDTGAPMNLINNRIAKDSGVLDAKNKAPAGLFGTMGQKKVALLEVGPAKLENATAVVMDHPTVAAISEALGPIDGIIGFPFFARYKATIDYQKREMTLVPNGYVPADAMEALMGKMMAAQNADKGPKIVGPAALFGFAVDKPAGDTAAGVAVTDVLKEGAAGKAGLKAGDRLLTLDARWTDTIGDTYLAASLVRVGRDVVLVVERGGQEVRLTVRPVRGV
ncbi:MAG TPA: aspartyl protease family protein [Urbifossiella sp.]|nr:aspartyl protease family protein [Urbifossiella sp.]